MLARVTVLLTFCARALKECECGGTLDNPIPDHALCDQLIPPGMEDLEPDRSFSLYSILFRWTTLDQYPFLTVTLLGSGSYLVYGYILQGRVDNEVAGIFIPLPNRTNFGISLNCLTRPKVSHVLIINYLVHIYLMCAYYTLNRLSNDDEPPLSLTVQRISNKRNLPYQSDCVASKNTLFMNFNVRLG